jgi:hypothetical protein
VLVWNTLGRTPAEIDAYCQVRGDAQATEYCLWNWQSAGYQDHAACFAAKRSEYKNACVRELLAQESGGSSLVPMQPPPQTQPPQPPQPPQQPRVSTASKFALGAIGAVVLATGSFIAGLFVASVAEG